MFLPVYAPLAWLEPKNGAGQITGRGATVHFAAQLRNSKFSLNLLVWVLRIENRTVQINDAAPLCCVAPRTVETPNFHPESFCISGRFRTQKVYEYVSGVWGGGSKAITVPTGRNWYTEYFESVLAMGNLKENVRFGVVICERMSCKHLSYKAQREPRSMARAPRRVECAPRRAECAPPLVGVSTASGVVAPCHILNTPRPAHSTAAYRRVQKVGRGEVTMHFAASRRRVPHPRRTTATSKFCSMATISGEVFLPICTPQQEKKQKQKIARLRKCHQRPHYQRLHDDARWCPPSHSPKNPTQNQNQNQKLTPLPYPTAHSRSRIGTPRPWLAADNVPSRMMAVFGGLHAAEVFLWGRGGGEYWSSKTRKGRKQRKEEGREMKGRRRKKRGGRKDENYSHDGREKIVRIAAASMTSKG
ncbi:hypothetical protein C8F04DRAFT_1195590 [Mycena alexandri]|uniref:Uncharacterized protein n=1 Tax=Mycena alexandri TaxID=1745969 RepID=A0AAD6S5N1_9AGAR|nr:hypothetical protein C8F04DRAFT_1195590 [Mycena alexandri]